MAKSPKETVKVNPIEPTHEGLIFMVKDGEELNVHPTCVKAHEAAGWKVKD